MYSVCLFLWMPEEYRVRGVTAVCSVCEEYPALPFEKVGWFITILLWWFFVSAPLSTFSICFSYLLVPRPLFRGLNVMLTTLAGTKQMYVRLVGPTYVTAWVSFVVPDIHGAHASCVLPCSRLPRTEGIGAGNSQHPLLLLLLVLSFVLSCRVNEAYSRLKKLPFPLGNTAMSVI